MPQPRKVLKSFKQLKISSWMGSYELAILLPKVSFKITWKKGESLQSTRIEMTLNLMAKSLS